MGSRKEEKKVALPVFSPAGEKVGEIEVKGDIFGAEVKPHLVYATTQAFLANQRQGTADTKERGEVSGSTRKLFRQKGTGRARMGSARSPLRVHGGVAFGPHPRDYRQQLPKKVRRQALLSALSSRAAAGELRVLDKLPINEISTKAMAELMQAFGLERTLLVTDEPNEVLRKSARNLAGLELARAADLNAYEVLYYRQIIFTREGLSRLQEVLA